MNEFADYLRNQLDFEISYKKFFVAESKEEFTFYRMHKNGFFSKKEKILLFDIKIVYLHDAVKFTISSEEELFDLEGVKNHLIEKFR